MQHCCTHPTAGPWPILSASSGSKGVVGCSETVKGAGAEGAVNAIRIQLTMLTGSRAQTSSQPVPTPISLSNDVTGIVKRTVSTNKLVAIRWFSPRQGGRRIHHPCRRGLISHAQSGTPLLTAGAFQARVGVAVPRVSGGIAVFIPTKQPEREKISRPASSPPLAVLVIIDAC
jgi:hypothetical protein